LIALIFVFDYSISVNHALLSKIDKAVKERQTSRCSVIQFHNILSPYLSGSACKQLFALYQQVFWPSL